MVYFYNLTNGIEATDINKLPHILRIQSSHIESKSWNHLFAQLSDELLFYLAIGKECCIIEGSPKPTRSTLAHVEIPIILYVLNRIWFDEKIPFLFIDKNYLERVFRSLSRSTRNKLKYYRKFLLVNEIKLNCFVFYTQKDGQYQWFREKIKTQKDG